MTPEPAQTTLDDAAHQPSAEEPLKEVQVEELSRCKNGAQVTSRE
jgi:hypothetical protein